MYYKLTTHIREIAPPSSHRPQKCNLLPSLVAAYFTLDDLECSLCHDVLYRPVHLPCNNMILCMIENLKHLPVHKLSRCFQTSQYSVKNVSTLLRPANLKNTSVAAAGVSSSSIHINQYLHLTCRSTNQDWLVKTHVDVIC